jgi:hypothetical protein
LSIIPTQNPILYTSLIININFANPSKFHATYLPYLVPWVDMDTLRVRHKQSYQGSYYAWDNHLMTKKSLWGSDRLLNSFIT